MIAHPTRLAILDRLRVAPARTSELIAESATGYANVSISLAKLRLVGAIRSRRVGSSVVNELTDLGRRLVEVAWRIADIRNAAFAV